MPAERRDPLRVAFCLDTLETGGTELNAVRTAEHFDPARVRVEFFALAARGPLVERVKKAGFPLHELPVRGVLSPQTVRVAATFAARLLRERFDVVHAHDIYTNMILVPWARIAGLPLVIASRRWWTETNHPLHARVNRLAYRFAHRVLANSESVGKLVEREGVPARRVMVVPNFVDDAAFAMPDAKYLTAMRRELSLSESDDVVGIVANLHAIKDHAMLLRATAILLPQHPRLKVVLIGDGAERERLEAQSRELGIQSAIVFAGKRPHLPTPHWLFSLSVLCSRGEGFPNSIVEAMAAGRAMVATAVGGVPDVIVDGETGTLVPTGDAVRLAQALDALLRNPQLAKQMGDAGARRAREVFNADRVVRRLESLYYEALGRSS
ncbi:MAG: glycosyltransferase [Gemmatimonadaceae bacterium]